MFFQHDKDPEAHQLRPRGAAVLHHEGVALRQRQLCGATASDLSER